MGKNVWGGNLIRFWEDSWVGDGRFMESYLRFYSVSLLKIR